MQVADTGLLRTPDGASVCITGVRKAAGGSLFVHSGEVGGQHVGMPV